MDHLLEISRIIDGAVKGDRAKVLAYVEQLVRKLQESGDQPAAERLARTAQQTKAAEVVTSSVTASPRLPVDNESRLALADEEWIDPSTVSVVLDPAISGRVEEFIRFAKASDKLLASRVGIAPSMLIYGPPGVGKTELARYIAAQLQLPLITARSDSLISSFLGSTAKNLRMLFEHARSRPCVLFLDELDSVAKLRDDQHELGELKRVVVSLLQNIDALDNQVIVLAATNHHHLLDTAVWRRFRYKLELGLPGFEARRQLFKLFLDGFEAVDGDTAMFASLANETTGADIRDICENAIRLSVLADQTTVETTAMLRMIVNQRLGASIDFSSTEADTIIRVHSLDPKQFTLKRLAALFNSSEPTISRRLKPGGNHAKQRTKAAD
jgi:SpoVK/Ycf46/Vps4 family AAA+-type ATPase